MKFLFCFVGMYRKEKERKKVAIEIIYKHPWYFHQLLYVAVTWRAKNSADFTCHNVDCEKVLCGGLHFIAFIPCHSTYRIPCKSK